MNVYFRKLLTLTHSGWLNLLLFQTKVEGLNVGKLNLKAKNYTFYIPNYINKYKYMEAMHSLH